MRSAASRSALVVRASASSYAGIALLKSGEAPEGPSKLGLKISTFKVIPQAQAHGVADILLSAVFEKAIEMQVDLVFITLFPHHQDLARYLELRGFRRAPRETKRGEYVYVADIAHPETMYSEINRLAYDLLADEYRSRSQSPGPTQETPQYLASLLTSRLVTPTARLLELGPGSGDVLLALSQHAVDTIAVEVSPRMAELATQRAPKALVIVADVLQLDFPQHAFDGIYAGAFLHLFPQSAAAQLIQRMARWTRPRGVVFANTSVSPGYRESLEVKADYLHRVARFRSRWTEDQFRHILESNGLTIIDRVTTDERERSKFWVAFLCSPTEHVHGR